MRIKEWLRGLVAFFYLVGALLHFYLGLTNPEIYRAFGQTSLLPGFSTFWESVVMPRIGLLALLLAIFELGVGLLLINRGRAVKAGLILGLLFNLFLVQLGLSFPAETIGADVYFNRLPNLVFAGLQFYLLFKSFPESIPALLRS